MNKIIITLKDGLVQSVQNPDNIELEIRDYDVDFSDPDKLFPIDENNTEYILRYPE